MEYIASGCDVISTSCTYQASVEGFRKYFHDNGNLVECLIDDCVKVAFKARRKYYEIEFNPRRVFVAISIGPYGAILANGSEYTGEYKDSMLVSYMVRYIRST